jgi:hypothetical protein
VAECYARDRSCVACKLEYAAKWRAANRERKNRLNRVSYARHRERTLEKWRQRRARSPRSWLRGPNGVAAGRERDRRHELLNDAGRLAQWFLRQLRKRNALLGVCAPDFDRAWLQQLLEAAVARGEVNLTRGDPRCASIDQKIAGLGYHKANVQILPMCVNFAKGAWALDDVRAALEEWLAAQRRAEMLA